MSDILCGEEEATKWEVGENNLEQEMTVGVGVSV